jgi:predicted ATPase
MAINRVEIKDFLVFKSEFAADFCDGVNVLIGENGVGKTTLLKILYASEDIADRKPYILERVDLGDYFNAGITKRVFVDDFFVHFYPNDIIYKSEEDIGFHINDEYLDGLLELIPQIRVSKNSHADSVFIPSIEILSHAKGLLALYHDRDISFDKTEMDLLAKAEKGSKRDVTDLAKSVMNKLITIIGGEIIYKDGDFFVNHTGIGEIKFSLEASGYRKLGLLWKLLRNGMLESGTVLFWDEPENSLNPELIPVIVDVLLELSRNGVQIFLATHSEILAGYFAVNRKRSDKVIFYSLYKESGLIKVDSNTRFDFLIPNNLSDEPVKLYKSQIVRGMGGSD